MRRIEVEGLARSYILDVPRPAAKREPVPVLLDFHGLGHSAAGVWRVSEFRALAAREGFITVYLDGLPVRYPGREGRGWEIRKWQNNPDVSFVAAVLDRLGGEYCVDQGRIYATGFSLGGYFCYVLACALGHRIAAIAPVGAGELPVACTPPRPLPAIIHHGRADPVVGVAQARKMRDAWVERNGCRQHLSDGCERHEQCRSGADVWYCEDDSQHRWPKGAGERIWRFLRAHRLLSEEPAGGLP